MNGPFDVAATPAGRLGVFGGTFDPVHLGHLRAVEEAREILDLDEIILIPAADPPHKRDRAISAANHRLAMVRLATRGNPGMRVSDIEIRRPGLSFTIDTLRQLQSRHRDRKLVLLMGLDAFREIDTWKEYQRIFELVDVGVMSRPPVEVRQPRTLLPVAVQRHFRYASDRTTLVHRTGNQVSFLSVTALDIAATDIRRRVRAGGSIRFLVPTAVERYIVRESLYRSATGSHSV